MVDLKQRKVIDLLPDRESGAVRKWLETHPGVEVISRDRADAYTIASREDAPNAI